MPTLPALMLYSGCALGAAGLVIWLLGLFARRASSRLTVPSTPATLALVGVGGYFAATDRLTGLGWPLLTLAGLLMLFGAVRSDRLIGILAAVSTFLRRPLCQWTAFSISCAAAAALVSFSAAPQIEPLPQESEPLPAAWLPRVLQMPSGTAVTDRGNEVWLWQGLLTARSEEKWKAGEKQEFEKLGLIGRSMQVAPADRSYNCSGWIFADGQYLLPDWEVDAILQDNGYMPVDKPAVGDLAVYRDKQGAICHTALVWGVGQDGRVLLESKWGWMGRFLHSPEATNFGQLWIYYHSARSGHLLRGLHEQPHNGRASAS